MGKHALLQRFAHWHATADPLAGLRRPFFRSACSGGHCPEPASWKPFVWSTAGERRLRQELSTRRVSIPTPATICPHGSGGGDGARNRRTQGGTNGSLLVALFLHHCLLWQLAHELNVFRG